MPEPRSLTSPRPRSATPSGHTRKPSPRHEAGAAAASSHPQAWTPLPRRSCCAGPVATRATGRGLHATARRSLARRLLLASLPERGFSWRQQPLLEAEARPNVEPDGADAALKLNGWATISVRERKDAQRAAERIASAVRPPKRYAGGFLWSLSSPRIVSRSADRGSELCCRRPENLLLRRGTKDRFKRGSITKVSRDANERRPALQVIIGCANAGRA